VEPVIAGVAGEDQGEDAEDRAVVIVGDDDGAVFTQTSREGMESAVTDLGSVPV
jgi:hypothetical protein